MARKSGSKADITGPKVREAAQRLFAQKGYAAVSMREIAKAVGVQVGAIYNYTPDKQSLLFDMMRGHMADLLAAWNDEVLPDDPFGRLEHFARFHIRFHIARPDAVFIAYMELRNLTAENFETIEQMRSEYEGVLDRILEDGQRQKLFDLSEPRLTAMGLIALLNGVNVWYRDGGRLGLVDVEEAYWTLVRRAVTPRPA